MDFPSKKVSKRFGIVAVCFILFGVVIIGTALKTMCLDEDFWMYQKQRFVKLNKSIPATRGNILADNGEVLASSIPEYKIYMDFMSWEKNPDRRMKDQHRRDSILYRMADSISNGMHALFPDINPKAFKENLLKGRKAKSHHWLLYNKRVTYIQYCAIKELPLFNLGANRGGFHTESMLTRKNPYGRLAIRTIGDLYKGKDSARTGLELSFDSILRGTPGIGRRQKVSNRYLTIIEKPAIDGCNVLTTINVSMQDICEKALSDKLTEIEAQSGVCILMEVATGDIKAMTSLQRMADGSYQEVNPDAVTNMLEPGSVFKPMSFLVGMDDGFIHMTDQVDVGCGIKEMYGAKMRDANWRSGGSGVVTVPQILQKSLNVGVSTLIDKFYHDNPAKFVEGIYRIGVAEDLKIPIRGYTKPRIRMPKADGSNWSKTALPWMSIGYETQVPPINTINFYNGIANNGKLLRPRLVKAILRGNEVVKEYPVVVLREQMAKPQAVKNIQDCLESVVSVGLGKKAGSRHFKVSGKTGTAQIWTKHGFSAQYLISFAGYFPSDKPLYSCIVCIVKGAPASGGGMCAPVFKRVAEEVMAQRATGDYSLARDSSSNAIPLVYAGNASAAASVLDWLNVKYNVLDGMNTSAQVWGKAETVANVLNFRAETGCKAQTVPDVSGYGLRDAVYRLEKIGLKVRSVGVGPVTAQSLKPGTPFKRGQEIILTLRTKSKNKVWPKTDKRPSDSAPLQTKKEPEDSELTPTLKDEQALKASGKKKN